MSVLDVKVKGGTGGIAAATIHAILPDIHNSSRAVVYTAYFPDGLPVEGAAEDLCAEWWAMMVEMEVENEC